MNSSKALRLPAALHGDATQARQRWHPPLHLHPQQVFQASVLNFSQQLQHVEPRPNCVRYITLTISASTDGGARSATAEVMIEIGDVNDNPPTITSPGSVGASIEVGDRPRCPGQSWRRPVKERVARCRS